MTATTADVWLRTGLPARVELHWGPEGADSAGRLERDGWRSLALVTESTRDWTVTAALENLSPGTLYQYEAHVAGERDPRGSEPADDRMIRGRFRTAPAPAEHAAVTFVWGGDLGGQSRCRRGPEAYPIFDRMHDVKPSFAVLLGDLIYADEVCAAPPNEPGSEFAATTLDEFRRKHRYQREAPSLQRFLSEVPVFVTWDDHEVRNNFSGPEEPLMPLGRRALLEYWPIRTPPGAPHRLYRRARYGADLEVFLLDARQYRSPNRDRDEPGKTMLGREQRDWLVESLTGSDATWKIIASSVPLSINKTGTARRPGNDSWARDSDGTGFTTELAQIIETLLERRVRNVVWLAGDVHFAQINTYDANRDQVTDFYEFVCGPLSAATVLPRPPAPDFAPTTLYSGGGFLNFGAVTVDRDDLTVQIIDDQGEVRFQQRFRATGAG